jgi:hypothetical protein
VNVANDVELGRGVVIYEFTNEDDVFIGHGVMFINDRHPNVTDAAAGTWAMEPMRVGRERSSVLERL